MGSIKSWEELDKLFWVEEEVGDDWGAAEEVFSYLYKN